MVKHYVSLFDSDWNGEAYRRGDIIIVESGSGPPGIAWAGFIPPADLKGTPALAHVADNGTGNLVFKYTIAETETTFILKARVGLPQADAFIVPGRESSSSVGGPPERTDQSQLRFGAGIATTETRSLVQWNPDGCRPAPQPQEDDDPLRADCDIDYLRRGM